MTRSTCTVDGCLHLQKARGYCPTHYAQWLREGKITSTVIQHREPVAAHCTAPECFNPVKSRGLCGMHWARVKRHGALEKPDRKTLRASCTVPGCVRPRYANGFCSRHDQRARGYRTRHNLSDAEILHVFEHIGGRCQICKRPQGTKNGTTFRTHGLYLDHDHGTGKLRGLLCNSCNRVLGMMKDNPHWLRKAADYLDQHTVTT
jgi:hypothetical protein